VFSDGSCNPENLATIGEKGAIIGRMNKIIRADCVRFMKKMGDGVVEFSFADPPYNVGYGYEGYEDERVDYREWCKEWFGELRRVTSGVVCVTPGTVNFLDWVEMERPSGVISWTKPYANSWNTLGRPNGACAWEPVLVYGKSKYLVKSDWIEASLDHGEGLSHPCPKPMKLLKQLIIGFSGVGGQVFDPFCGSGKIAVACKILGREFVGTEIVGKYVREARGLVEKAERQTSFGQMEMNVHQK